MIIEALAREFYQLKTEEVAEKLRKLPKWPSHRRIVRVLKRQKAVRRLANPNLRILVKAGWIAIVECDDGNIYPVRVTDVLWGYDTTPMIKEAKLQDAIRSIVTDEVPRFEN